MENEKLIDYTFQTTVHVKPASQADNVVRIVLEYSEEFLKEHPYLRDDNGTYTSTLGVGFTTDFHNARIIKEMLLKSPEIKRAWLEAKRLQIKCPVNGIDPGWIDENGVVNTKQYSGGI